MDGYAVRVAAGVGPQANLFHDLCRLAHLSLADDLTFKARDLEADLGGVQTSAIVRGYSLISF